MLKQPPGGAQPPSTPPTRAQTSQVDESTFTSRKRRQQVQQEATQRVSAAPGGVYLLTIMPVSRYEGTASMKTLAGGISSGLGNIPGVGSRWEVEGVQLKAIRLDA